MGTNARNGASRNEMDRASGDPRRPARWIRRGLDLGVPTQSSVCRGDERAELRKHCKCRKSYPGSRRTKQPGKGVTQMGRCEHEQSCGSRRRGWRDQNDYRRGHNCHLHDTRRLLSPMLPLVSAPAKACCRVSIVVVQTVEGWSSSVAIVSKRHSIATRWPADGTRSSARSTHRSHQLPLHGPGHCLHRLTIDRARAHFFLTQKRPSGFIRVCVIPLVNIAPSSP